MVIATQGTVPVRRPKQPTIYSVVAEAIANAKRQNEPVTITFLEREITVKPSDDVGTVAHGYWASQPARR